MCVALGREKCWKSKPLGITWLSVATDTAEAIIYSNRDQDVIRCFHNEFSLATTDYADMKAHHAYYLTF